MNIFVITDTHLGHKKLIELEGRPAGIDRRILKNVQTLPRMSLLICLGDVAIPESKETHRGLTTDGSLDKWLIRGNHDSKSLGWYLDCGWSAVTDGMRLNRFGMDIVLSHKPMKDDGYDLNIHGHFHDNDHRCNEPKYLAIKNDRQMNLSLVKEEYRPVRLRTLVERFRKGK